MINEGEKRQGKKCFIITPIGDAGSDIFRKAKGVIDSVIKPVLIKYGFTDIKPAYEILESGMIGNQIIDRIVNDDLVIANLTGNNPNVMYELAIRHAVAKPIIHICEKGTKLPFDIKDNRTSFYADDMLGVQELQKEFEDYVIGIDYSREYKDNPIYNGIAMSNFMRDLGNSGKSTEAELLQKILDRLPSDQEQLQEEKKKITITIPSFETMEADYLVETGECTARRHRLFGCELEEEMKLLNIEIIIDKVSGDIYLKNKGNIDYKILADKVRYVAGKCGIKAKVIANPSKMPTFEEMLEESLRREKEMQK